MPSMAQRPTDQAPMALWLLLTFLSAKPRKAAEGPHSAKPFVEGTVDSEEALRKGSRKDLIPH